MSNFQVNQIGDDIIKEIESFAKTKDMSFDDFLIFLMNVNFYKKKNPNYDDKGIYHPMIIGNHVVKIIGTRYYSLKARPKLVTDTPEALIDMANIDEANIDKTNESNYITIFSFNDN
jgi:hypothetical protein